MSAARIRLTLLALAALAPAGAAAGPAPSVTLLAPGNGTLVEGAPPAFRWQIDVPNATSGQVTITHRVGADPSLTRELAMTTRTCPAQNVNCWTSHTLRQTLRGPRFWQVSVTGAVSATSRTWMFVGVTPRVGPDKERPRVVAYRGAGRRGRKAVFVARVSDNRGEARLRVDLLYRNQLVFRAMTLLKPVRWSVRQRFDSRTPLPRSLAPGPYRVCVTAWDRTGNEARSCARYSVH